MSIYSGFATRSQQQTYDQLSYQLIQLLSLKILKTYLQQPTDQLKFAKIIKQIFIKLSIMQKQKYLQPNLSSALYQIVQHYLKHQQPSKKLVLNQKNSFWVKIQDKSEQNFTQDTHKNQSRQLTSRKTSVNFDIKPKATIINPQKNDNKQFKERKTNLEALLKEKRQINLKKGQKLKESRNKHHSLRQFQLSRLNHDIDIKQYSQKKEKCPHCCQQNLYLNKKSSRSKNKQQRADSIKRKQFKESRIIVPDIVRQYIEATNHAYMKHYRKRKVKFCSEYN